MRDWLIKLRIDQNITQEKVADMSEIERTYYNMIENGKRRPGPEVAQRLGRTLNFDWTIFFNNESNETTLKEEASK